MGSWTAPVQIVAAVAGGRRAGGRVRRMAGARPPSGRCGSWRSAIRSPPASALPASDAFPAKLERALKAKGLAVEIANAGVSGDTASGGLARLDWSVPDGHRRGDPRARRQRHAARHRSEGHARGARGDPAPAEGARASPVLLAGMRAAPNLGRRLCARRSRRSIPSSPRSTACCSIRSSSTASPPTRRLNQRDGIHPTAAGIDVIVDGILPKVEELVARVRGEAWLDNRRRRSC